MNGIAFEESYQGKKFDANFISVYNKEKDEYEYYIQRLIGINIENEEIPKMGRIWVPYINNKKEDWGFLCDNNRIISKEDDLIWKFEKFLGKDAYNTLGGLSHEAEGGPDSGGNPTKV